LLWEKKLMTTLASDLHVPGLSGERFQVEYQIAGTDEEVRTKADNITVEQTVEFPVHLIPDSNLLTSLVGQIERYEKIEEGRYAVNISYAIETAGTDFPQLLNVIQGLSSLIPGIKVEKMRFPDALLHLYQGPRFGVDGWRKLLGVRDRPLLCTAIKPMSLSIEQLADMAYQCALGGLDIMKDDHGISNLPFSPFEERVPCIAEAVAKANRETGLNCIYAANITGPAQRIVERAIFAKKAGATALLISPALTGFDAMREVADDDRVNLPILSHPTVTGNFVHNADGGFSYYAYYGQLHRLAGADSPVFVNYGGRFPAKREDCQGVIDGCSVPMAHIKPAVPCVGGGMKFECVPELLDMYGKNAIFLIGGGLHSASDDLVANVRQFLRLVQ
jgi:ribulose-bisphosphate carboxylase large chain